MKKGALVLPLLVSVFVALSVLNSCKREIEKPTNEDGSGFSNLMINPDFRFETSSDISLTVIVLPSFEMEPPHIIKIFTDNPLTGGKLMKSGMTGVDLKFSTTLKIPTKNNSLFLEDISSYGLKKSAIVEIFGTQVEHTFSGLTKNTTQPKSTVADPGCISCSHVLSGTTTALIHSGERFCVETSQTWSGQFKFYGGGELVICGTASNITLNPSSTGGTIYISDGGVMTIQNLYVTNALKVENYGEAHITSVLSISSDGIIENHGDLTCNTFTNYANSGGVTNYGTIQTITFLNNLGIFTNENLIQVGSYLSNNATGNFYNNCRIVIETHVNQVGTLYLDENTSVEVGGLFDSWAGSNTIFGVQSLIVAQDSEIEGILAGPVDGCARMEITRETEIKSGGSITNNLDFCDENGIEINNGIIEPSVTFCQCYVPLSDCNEQTFGAPPIDDADGDGVPDDEDKYPYDPERAFDEFYPNNTDFGTLVYEDLWPSCGDYDFNDLVIEFQYQMVTNSLNQYVDIIGTFLIKAAGGTFDNGFGFVIPVSPAFVSAVTGPLMVEELINLSPEGYETGHSNETVVIVYDAIISMAQWSMINTIPEGNTVEFDTTIVTINFDQPQNAIGQAPFNPFIFINQIRGKEVHLIDNQPTELVDPTYFGTFSDVSNPGSGIFYKTAGNLPWAIEIPVSFDYPIEKTDLTQAYLMFENWAVSGGIDFTDWYMDLPGYRDAENIY